MVGYESNIKNIISPYFRDRDIKLCELTTINLQDFYDYQYSLGKSARTILHYHNNIHGALEKAKKTKLISINISDDCILQRPTQYIPDVYSSKELGVFLEKIKDSDIEIPSMLIAFYGLRRSEAIGLKWHRVDFENNKITIAHTVTTTSINGKRIIEKKDIAKNRSSYRTFPLIPIVKEFLLRVLAKQEEDKRIFKNSYKNEENYVCVNMEGNLINPDSLTKIFPKFLEDNGLRKIRIHDLRHSIGSLLVNNGRNLQEIQEWLGHSNIQTTQIYSHLDSSSKSRSANTISNVLPTAI